MYFILSTINSSLMYLPSFFPQLIISSFFLLFFLLPATLFFKKKLFILIGFYLSVASFIIFVDIFSRFGVAFNNAISIVSFVYLLFCIYSLKKLKKLKKFIIGVKINKYVFTTLLLATFLSIFIFGKYIFNNGLHDEYQHHAVVELMRDNPYLPIVDEYRYDLNISDYYHYGWYYLVLFISMFTHLSIELSLDIAKLVLFIPIIPTTFFIVQNILKKNSYFESLLISVLVLIQGPSFFLFDSYSQNVFLGKGQPIIFQPLFFQLAGITWFGLLFCYIFSYVFYYLLNNINKFRYALFFFTMFSLYGMFLLNKAYILLLIVNYILISFYLNFTQIKKIIIKNKIAVVLLLSLGLSIGIVLIKTFFPLLFEMASNNEGSIPFIRSFDKVGFPYSGASSLEFAKLSDIKTLLGFGLLPIMSLFVLVYKLIREKKKVKWIVISILYLFLLLFPYLISFSGGELALNKFYIPLFTTSVFIIFYNYHTYKLGIKLLILFILSLSVISPGLYLASLSLPQEQIYWDYSDPIIEYLKTSTIHTPLIVMSDFEYGKYIINNLEVQLIASKVIDNYESINPDFIISESELENYELVAKSNNHYLYKL